MTQVLLALVAVLAAAIPVAGHFLAERRQAALLAHLHSNGAKLDKIGNGLLAEKKEVTNGA